MDKVKWRWLGLVYAMHKPNQATSTSSCSHNLSSCLTLHLPYNRTGSEIGLALAFGASPLLILVCGSEVSIPALLAGIGTGLALSLGGPALCLKACS